MSPNLLELRLPSLKLSVFVVPKHAIVVQAAEVLMATGATFFICPGMPTNARACACSVTVDTPRSLAKRPGAVTDARTSIVPPSGKDGENEASDGTFLFA